MTFTSLSFAAFLPLVFLAYSLLGARFRHVLLLVASLAFYAVWGYHLPVLLVAVGLVTWAVGLKIHHCSRPMQRNAWMWGGAAFILFFLVAVRLPGVWPEAWRPAPAAVWPTIGLSFLALQAVSYLVDVCLAPACVEKRPDFLLLSLAFFPKILQGPVERPAAFTAQLRHPAPFDYQEMRRGLLIAFGGLFKKVVLADRIRMFIDPLFNRPGEYEGTVLLVAVYLYAAQIYFDFSGYTDMATGVARMFGIRLSPNFNRPYAAKSVMEFWRRWHISFSSWLLDYIFKPLQLLGRNLGSGGTALALLATFFLSGLWHGTTWNFVIWGLLHGGIMACSAWSARWRKSLVKRHRWLRGRLAEAGRLVLTFHLVALSWVFFRTGSPGDAWALLTRAWSRPAESLSLLTWQSPGAVFYLAFGLVLYLLFRRQFGAVDPVGRVLSLPPLARWAGYYAAVVSTWLLCAYAEGNFIYFRF